MQGIFAGLARDLGRSMPWPEVDAAVDSVLLIGQDNVANGATIYSDVGDAECGLYNGFLLVDAKV